MRRIVLAAAIVVVTLVAGVPAASAGFNNPYQLRLIGVEQSGQDQFVDVGAPGDSPGDSIYFREGLYRWENGRRGPRIGLLQVVCTFPGGGLINCMTTAFVPRGTIVAGGFFRFVGGRFTVPVLGGTGIYRGVGGVIKGRELPRGRTAYVFQLTR